MKGMRVKESPISAVYPVIAAVMIIGLTYIPGRVFEDPRIICIWKCFEGCKMLCRCKWSYCSAFRSGSRSLAIYDCMWDAGRENVRQAEGNSKRGQKTCVLSGYNFLKRYPLMSSE